jgi:hypothetical protein
VVGEYFMASSNFYISIILATNSIDRLKNFLDHLEALTANPEYLEVLLNIDHDATALHAFILQESRKRPFLIKYHQRDNSGGYFDLNLGYDDLLNYLDHNSYFVMLLSDAFRFTTIDWDLIVRQYYRLFPDDLFYLRISNNKYVYHRNYSEVWDRCENWGVYTKKWLSVVKGWGAFWCPDAWQEMIHMQFLIQSGYSRSIPLPLVKFVKLNSSYGNKYEGARRWILGELFLARIMLSRTGLKIFRNNAINILQSIHKKEELNKLNKRVSLIDSIKVQLNLSFNRKVMALIRLYFLFIPSKKLQSFIVNKFIPISPYLKTLLFDEKVSIFLSNPLKFKKIRKHYLLKYLPYNDITKNGTHTND